MTEWGAQEQRGVQVHNWTKRGYNCMNASGTRLGYISACERAEMIDAEPPKPKMTV